MTAAECEVTAASVSPNVSMMTLHGGVVETGRSTDRFWDELPKA
jgi:hypothetical protein